MVSQTEMAFLDYARPGSHFIRHESIASASSSSPSTSMPLHRLSCTARLPSSVAVSVSSPSRVSLGYGGGIRGGRARAASGSVQQEEIAAVGTISVGQYLVQGLREEMEDEIAVDVDGLKGFSYAAIFDGHAGDFSAKYLRWVTSPSLFVCRDRLQWHIRLLLLFNQRSDHSSWAFHDQCCIRKWISECGVTAFGFGVGMSSTRSA